MLFFFSSYGHHRDLHSFPTRRSSDLLGRLAKRVTATEEEKIKTASGGYSVHDLARQLVGVLNPDVQLEAAKAAHRSEEHTSELQSRLHLVCRLLLEKKKKKINQKKII